MLWIIEGFMLDEAGNLIQTSYVDLGAPDSRTEIRGLVKGCRREHALEDAEKILVSPVERFRDEGESLIRDEQEGMATRKTEIAAPENPAEAVERRRIADLNEAFGLLDVNMQATRRETSHHVTTSSNRLSFGKEWWIFSTSLTPETDEQWAAWRATLDPEYDHVSKIGRPAKFAEALGRMVVEQLGPQGKGGWMQGAVGEGENARTEHPSQHIVHGPVVYTDRLYDSLMRDTDERTRLAASIFTKSATHAAQREYRFAILCDGTVDEKEFLAISGMMRDALPATTLGLVRPVPELVGDREDEEVASSSPGSGPWRLLYQRERTTERATQRQERRLETRGPAGELLSSETESQESLRERTLTRDLGGEDECVDTPASVGRGDEEWGEGERDSPVVGAASESRTDEDAVKEIALAERACGDRDVEDEGIPVIHGGTGRAYKSLKEMFGDPACPMGPMSESWAEGALGRKEMQVISRFSATLAHKVTHVGIEHREAASSACWQALQCIRNILVGLGDIVATVAIERERFVVLRIKASEEQKAAGRIVVSPSGAYAYCFKRSGKELAGGGEDQLGMAFFPMGSQVETFESFGWPAKEGCGAD